MMYESLYAIVDRDTCQNVGVDPVVLAEFLVQKKVPFLQYRDKSFDFSTDPADREKLDFHKIVWDIRQLTWGTETKFILNDSMQYALDVDADGVHLGQEDLDQLIAEVEADYGISKHDFTFDQLLKHEQFEARIFKDFHFGVSTHSVVQAIQAEKYGATYIGVGPIFATPTKPEADPLGEEVAREMKHSVRIPTVGIGGIAPEEFVEVKKLTEVDYCAMVRGCINLYKESL